MQKTVTCTIPYSDFYMEDLDIDPCYEGVLRFLRKEMGGSDVDNFRDFCRKGDTQ